MFDPWAHVDGTPHAVDGPLGCLKCANERRKLSPSELLKVRPREMPRQHGPRTRQEEEDERMAATFLRQLSGLTKK